MLGELNEKIRNLPGSVAARELLVQRGLQAVDELAKEAGNDPALLWDLARAYEGIATLQGSPDPGEPSLGDWDRAQESYGRALEIAKRIEPSRPNDPEMLLLLCKLHVSLGSLWGVTVSPGPGHVVHLNESLRYNRLVGSNFSEKLFWSSGGQPLVPYLARRAYFSLSGIRQFQDDPKGALELSGPSGPILGPRVESTSLYLMGDLQGAIQALQPSIAREHDYFSQTPAEDLMTQIRRMGLGQMKIFVGRDLYDAFGMSLGDRAGARKAYTEAIRVLTEVVRRDPVNPAGQGLLHTAWMHLADLLAEDQPAQSIQTYRKALEYTKPGWLVSSIDAQWKITYPMRKVGRRREALEQARLAAESNDTSGARLALAEALAANQEGQAAGEQFRNAIDRAASRVATRPHHMPWRAALAETYERSGRFYATAGNRQAAQEHYQKALEIWRTWTQFGISNPYRLRRERQAALQLARARTQFQKP
jgi:tetratricopeptide (TPR) repeat protein